MKYTLFFDEPEVELDELSQYGEVMEVGNFLQLCIGGYFTDYDGYGKFVVKVGEKEYQVRDVSFSIFKDEVYLNLEVLGPIFWFCNEFGIKKIIWFNK